MPIWPLTDDKGINAIVRRPDRTYAEVQTKARSKDRATELAGLFVGIWCERKFLICSVT